MKTDLILIKAITKVAYTVDLEKHKVYAWYSYPNDKEDCLLLIEKGRCDIEVFKDFLNYLMPSEEINNLNEEDIKPLVIALYKMVVRHYLRGCAKNALKKAANTRWIKTCNDFKS